MFEKIAEVAKTLKKREIANLRNWYRGNKNDGDKMGIQLLEELLNEKWFDDVSVCRKIFNRDPEPAYWRVKSRLMHLMMDYLLMGDGEDKYDSDYLSATFETRKKIHQADVLLKRGAYTPALYLLGKSGDMAEEWDLAYEKVMIYDLMSTHMGSLHGKNEYEKYSQKFHDAMENLDYVMKAKHQSHELEVPYAFFDMKEEGFKEKAKSVMDNQHANFKKTGSPTIGYYYYHTGATANRIMKNFSESVKFSNELIDLLKKRKEIYSDPRMGMALGQLAQGYLGMQDYKNALKAAQKSKELFNSESLNELRALELIFISAFHLGEYKIADDTIKEASNHPHLDDSNLDECKWGYFRAHYHFKKGNYTASLNQLNKINVLFRDKSGWIIGLKLLELMNLLESGIDFSLSYHRMDSMVQMLARQKVIFASKVWRVGAEEGMVLGRVTTISKVLKTLIDKNNDFYLTKLDCQKELKQLTEGNGEFDWNPAGLELTRFDEWFEKNCPKPIVVKKG